MSSKDIHLIGLVRQDVKLSGRIILPVGYNGDYENYEGPYEVIPKIESQSLSTKNKCMSNNVTIREIPYYEVSNASNGETIIIGGEIK